MSKKFKKKRKLKSLKKKITKKNNKNLKKTIKKHKILLRKKLLKKKKFKKELYKETLKKCYNYFNKLKEQKKIETALFLNFENNFYLCLNYNIYYELNTYLKNFYFFEKDTILIFHRNRKQINNKNYFVLLSHFLLFSYINKNFLNFFVQKKKFIEYLYQKNKKVKKSLKKNVKRKKENNQIFLESVQKNKYFKKYFYFFNSVKNVFTKNFFFHTFNFRHKKIFLFVNNQYTLYNQFFFYKNSIKIKKKN